MIVSCANCNSKYSVDDSKIKGKRFGFNCPKCGENVEIDNRNILKNKDEEVIEQSFFREDAVGKTTKTATQKKADIQDEDLLFEEDNLAAGMTGKEKKKVPSVEQDELPSDEELSTALGGLESEIEEDAAINMKDMELPDLEDLETISESGETADDQINVGSGKASIGESIDIDFEDETIDNNFSDKSGKKHSAAPKDDIDGLLDDFSPMEEDIRSGKEDNGEILFTDELGKSEDESEFIDEVKSDEIFSHENKMDDEDENITIDLDSLDIQLEEDDENRTGEGLDAEEISETFEPAKKGAAEIMDFEEDIESGIKEKQVRTKEASVAVSEDEEDITLDLDSLDLTLDEVEELKEGEAMEMDDERISLSDAGLTPDELVKDKEVVSASDTEDEDIRLNIDEVAPEVGIAKAPQKKKTAGVKLFDESELPEIDLDKFEEDEEDFSLVKKEGIEDLEDIRSDEDFIDDDTGMDNPDADIRDTVPGGMVSFSIDYSLGFSRLGALVRLLSLYSIVLIPHFIVLLVYSVLSVVLSLFNWLIIAFSGTHEEDFTEIQKNTIRYMLSLSACSVDIVEDMPQFAGRKEIDYPLQYDVTYPVRYSRVLAILRVTGIGILLAALPHIVLLAVLSVGSALICLIGLIMIIVRKRWPNVLFDFMIKYYRYAANVLSYITGVIDRYPSFKFE